MNDPFYILAFLERRGLDYQHRSLKDVWSFSDNQIEHTHDFIQWVFPTTEPSQNVNGSPVLSAEELELVFYSDMARASVLDSSEWFLNFLTRNKRWTCGRDHNHQRITRMLRSLKLIGENTTAENHYAAVLSILEGIEQYRSVEEALTFWRREIT